MKLTEYKIKNGNFTRSYTFAIVSDLHNNDPKETLDLLDSFDADYILAPGDIFEPLDGTCDHKNEVGYELLTKCSEKAYTFFSPGNHEVGGIRSWSLKWRFSGGKEKGYTENNLKRIEDTGVCFLDDAFVIKDNIAFAGLGSGLINKDRAPRLDFLDEFCKLPYPKILLCHHPEYYEKYLKDLDIDLIVSGHAHGGQWRFFGRGVFAPGQGLFPKYTSGVHFGKLVVSKGLKKGRTIPRIFNSPEVVKIVIGP